VNESVAKTSLHITELRANSALAAEQRLDR
jgi:hypothetical protein